MGKAFLYRECSQHTDLLDEALAKAQGCFKTVVRNREGPYGKFADLASMVSATKDALAENLLAVRQYFNHNEDRSMTLVTELSCKGQWVVSGIPIPAFTNPQHTHGYCTYMARLGYSRILCLAVDDASDNDGQNLPEAEPTDGTDINPILSAVRQAANVGRLDQLWERVTELKLPKQQLLLVEAAFKQRQMQLDDKAKKPAPKKEVKPDADGN